MPFAQATVERPLRPQPLGFLAPQPSAGAGPFAAMDEILKLLLTVAVPIATVALAAGGVQWQLKNLNERDKKREDDFERFRDDDRTRSHELNIKLAEALDSQAVATSKLVDFECRRGEQIDRNTQRGRINRARIERIEDNDKASVVRKLRSAGVPDEVMEDITDVMARHPEMSSVMPKAEGSTG